MTSRNALIALTAITLGACAPEDSQELDLTADEQVAMDAAIKSLDPVREDLPVEDDELETMAVRNIEEARDYANCEVMGVLSGVWYDQAYAPVLEGSWFELGSGELGGTLDGEYAEGAFEGDFGGSNLGSISGVYDDGFFLGSWSEVGEDGTLGASGELGGRYERRNDLGGYFFGLWGQCD